MAAILLAPNFAHFRQTYLPRPCRQAHFTGRNLVMTQMMNLDFALGENADMIRDTTQTLC